VRGTSAENSLWRGQQLFQYARRGRDGGGESSRTGFAFERDVALGVDDVNAIRPARVGETDFVVQVVDEDGNGNLEPRSEFARDLAAFRDRRRILDGKILARETWTIDRVGFANVDDVDVGFVLIRGIQFLDPTDRGDERRSRATAEDEDDGFAFEIGKLDGFLTVGVVKMEVRCGGADFQVAVAPKRTLALHLRGGGGNNKQQ